MKYITLKKEKSTAEGIVSDGLVHYNWTIACLIPNSYLSYARIGLPHSDRRWQIGDFGRNSPH